MTRKEIINMITCKINDRINSTQDLEKWEDMYNNIYPILNKERYKAEKANNKLVNNFGKKIVDDNTSFFLGYGLNVTSSNLDVNNAIKKELKRLKFSNVVNKLALDSALYGESFLLLSLNTTGNLNLLILHPRNVIYNTDVYGNVQNAIVFWNTKDFETEEDILSVEYYTDDNIISYSINKDRVVDYKKRANKFRNIPVLRFCNNYNKTGEIVPIETLINTYNLVLSLKVDDFEEFSHSYMLMYNIDTTDTNFYANMRNSNIINFSDKPQSQMEQKKGEPYVKFLTKESNVEEAIKILEILENNIYALSQSVNFNNFNESRVISVQAKMLPLVSKINIKETYFFDTLSQLFTIIRPYMENRYNIAYDVENDIDFKINRPTFTNIKEEAEIALLLKQIPGITKERIIGMVSNIPNAREEIEKYLEEVKCLPELYTESEEETADLNPINDENVNKNNLINI